MHYKKLSILCVLILSASSLFAQWSTGTDIYNTNSGRVGIGTSIPATKFNLVHFESNNWISTLDNSGTSGHKMYFGYNDGSSTTYGLYINGGRNLSTQLDLAVENKFYVMGNGYVGIGTSTPASKLAVSSSGHNIMTLNSGASMENGFVFQDNTANRWELYTQTNAGHDYFSLYNYRNSLATLTMLDNGNLGLGTASPAERLSVNGNISANGSIYAKKLVVKPNPWADYVFNDDYQLRSLASLEQYIQQNKHLPDVPSAAEVEQNGINVADNQVVLLKKIEELTLYVIALEKKLEKLQSKINN